ncbi:MAG: riboflavin synthase [Myxococcota bacterium]
MFTGIVEAIGTVVQIDVEEDRVDLVVRVTPEFSGVKVGDSVAINGCCLTVTAVDGVRLSFQVVPETLRLTSLGARAPGDRVNLERAMRADARFDGHIVQGHVDGTGRIRSIRRVGSDVLLRTECGSELARQLVPRGSITLDGVSLTVIDPDASGFTVALIPHTLAVTTLGERQVGDGVNLELDVLGKYVLRYLERRGEHGAAG